MNKKILVGSLVIVAAVFSLLIFATPGATGVELPVAEIAANPEAYEGKYILVTGNLLGDSVEWDSKNTQLYFSIRDLEGTESIAVKHKGIRPDNFDDGVIAIIEGKYDLEEKIFVADRLMTRCPSKYEGEDPSQHPDGVEKRY